MATLARLPTMRAAAAAAAAAAAPSLRTAVPRMAAMRRAVAAVSGVRAVSSSSSAWGIRAPLRCFSSAAASGASAAAPGGNATAAGASTSSAVGVATEVKLMAHYVGAECFSLIPVSAWQAAGAYRFTQPSSVLLPLSAGPGSASATAPGQGQGQQAAQATTLANLFSLPPLPVAPIVRIPSASSTPASQGASLPSSSSLAFDARAPFVVAFAYGALVFFNASEAQQAEFLANASLKSDAAKLKDDYRIQLRGGGSAGSTGTEADAFACRFLTDSVEVASLDVNGVRIVSQILSQAVAMQHYEGEANRLLLKLRAMMRPSDLHKGVSTLGHQRSDLIVRYVAESSTAMIDVLTELKLLDRSEVVWGHGQYDPLWSGLRREFDLADRWDALQTKLDLLRDSHPFFLQVIHQLQSHRMEIIIILLIFIEVVLSVAFHSPLPAWAAEQLGLSAPEGEEDKPKHVSSKMMRH